MASAAQVKARQGTAFPLFSLLQFILILQDVGCDGILGSGAVVDQCGMCGGDGSTCRVISGIFTRVRLAQHGYHHVTTIPTGACNINITEMARSRNYIALSTSAGLDIVNTDRQLRPMGEYRGAGTSFDYRRRSGRACPGACIFADGPLTMPVKVQLLYYDRNPGIMYHFTVPQDTATDIMNAANSTHNNRHHHHNNNNNNKNNHKTHHNPRQRHGEKDAAAAADRRRSGPNDSLGPSSKAGTRTSSHQQRHKQHSSNNNAADVTTASLRDAPAGHHNNRNDPRQRHHQARRRGGRQHRGRDHARPATGGSNPQRTVPLVPAARASSNSNSTWKYGSRQANVANAPLFVPPEKGAGSRSGGSGGGGAAQIQYRHYYHVDSDDYRRLKQTAGFSALDASTPGRQRLTRNDVLGAGSEALRRPNIIQNTRNGQRGWESSRSRGGGGGRRDSAIRDNDLGDVPLAIPASGFFVWTISGFSSCSHPCGGGTQETLVVCMKSDTRVVVMAENCDINARPSPTTVDCNTQPCDARWTEAEWSECSVTCGHGVQSRRVECKQRISPTLHISVSADRCSDTKPPVTQFCRRPHCFTWTTSNWTKCSTDCGLGERTRTVWCKDGEGRAVQAPQCREVRPTATEICDMGSCAKGWYYSRWSKDCSPQCGGKTHKVRKVYCAADNGGTLPGDKCPADKKPRTRKPCGQAKPCGGKWYSGPWSQCNASCGEAWRAREVVCMKNHGRRLWGVVDKENCLRKERPPAKETCTELPPCQPEWYMTHWSECSKECDTGSKTREVKCLTSANLRPSISCNGRRRPRDRRSCNKQSCSGGNTNTNTTSTTTATSSRRPHRHRHTNDYDSRPRGEERLRESTSPNTTFDRHHRHRDMDGPAPLTLKVPAAPAEISLMKDLRSAMGDDSASHHSRKNHKHTSSTSTTTSDNDNDNTNDKVKQKSQTVASSSSSSSSSKSPDSKKKKAGATATEGVADADCKDSPNSRWCMVVSQARLCRYGVYQLQCCHTCTKYLQQH